MSYLSHTKEYRKKYWRKWKEKNRPDKKKYCEKCDQQFSPNSNNQKVCLICRKLFCRYCGKEFYPKNLQRNQKYCSNKCNYADRKGIEPQWLKENRGKKPRTYHLNKRDKHGGILDREWRETIFKRDNYICQDCKQKGGKLEAHHIKPYKKYPELRYDLKNGITFCVSCHKKTDSYGWANYWKSQKGHSN